MKKKLLITVCSALLGISMMAESVLTASAQVPYDTYSFNYWGEEVEQPHAYLYEEMLTSDQFGVSLSFPEDMCIQGDSIYVADTGNSRVLKMDLSGNVELEITCADGKTDPLNGPQGIFLTQEGHLYVADSGNGRIVEYDENGVFLRSIGRPETTLIADTQEYKPTKVVVDNAGRIYAVAYGINLGLVEFDKNGMFQGFMGATEVSVNYFTYVWKNYFSTEAQQARMETIVPTEYSNIFVDEEGFIYATINNLSEEDLLGGADAIRRLNPTGTDVLRRLGNYDIIGDINSHTMSSFCDVAATDYGCYYILDGVNGKVFAYDYDGNSLFVFGKTGSKEGNMNKPVALALTEDEEKVYVLDKVLGGILVFGITDYGKHLMNALYLNNIGDAEGSTAEWLQVLKSNSNNEMAYIGLGKAYLTEGNYKKAMEYFELGNSRKYYTKAFYYHRKELMEEKFGTAMLVLILLIAVLIVVRYIFRFKRWVGEVRCFMSKRLNSDSM